jgi:hypothetical protein
MGTYGIETHDLQNVFHIWPVIVGLMWCCLALLSGLKEFRDWKFSSPCGSQIQESDNAVTLIWFCLLKGPFPCVSQWCIYYGGEMKIQELLSSEEGRVRQRQEWPIIVSSVFFLSSCISSCCQINWCFLCNRNLYVVEVINWSGTIELSPDGSWAQHYRNGATIHHPNIVSCYCRCKSFFC